MRTNYYKTITILGMLISVLWIKEVNTQPISDFSYYNELAKQIANGGVWGNTYTSVGYSIILGFIYSIFGSSLIVAKIFNLVLTLISYIIVYNLLKKIDLSETRRRIIYALFVFFPNNIFYNSIVGNEILFTNILLLITLIYYSNIKFKYALIGLLTGINTMVKPFFIIFFLVIFITELILKMKFLSILKHTVIVLLVSIICVSPWVYRNTKLIGEFTSISNNGGIVLYINNNSQNNYGKWMPAEKVENSIVLKKEYIRANMTQKNKMLTAAAKNWITNHPVQFIELGFKRLFNTYFIADDISFGLNGANVNRYFEILLRTYAFLMKIILFVPAIIYVIIHSKKIIANLFNQKDINPYDLYNLICFYMFTSVYFITEGQGRYAFPTIFIMTYFFSELVGEVRYFKMKIKIKDIAETS